MRVAAGIIVTDHSAGAVRPTPGGRCAACREVGRRG